MLQRDEEIVLHTEELAIKARLHFGEKLPLEWREVLFLPIRV